MRLIGRLPLMLRPVPRLLKDFDLDFRLLDLVLLFRDFDLKGLDLIF